MSIFFRVFAIYKLDKAEESSHGVNQQWYQEPTRCSNIALHMPRCSKVHAMLISYSPAPALASCSCSCPCPCSLLKPIIACARFWCLPLSDAGACWVQQPAGGCSRARRGEKPFHSAGSLFLSTVGLPLIMCIMCNVFYSTWCLDI